MKLETTSKFKNLSGDSKLNILKKIYWFVVAWLNINFEKNYKDSRIKQHFLKVKRKLSIQSIESPSRVLSDLFWENYDWTVEMNFFKKKINLIEIGCGSGKYALIMKKILKKKINSYTGVDLQKNLNWDRIENTNIKFHKKDCLSISKLLQNKNLIITQSAIEHFKYDLTFFKLIKKNIEKNNKKILQIHLMPSSKCLYTYMWHGYRHYNCSSISKITKVFDQKYSFDLYNLGSANLNKFHFEKLTIPRFLGKKELRESDPKLYRKLLLENLKKDILKPVINNVCFFALVIRYNPT